MTIETIFSLSNLLVLPFWVLIIFLPHWSWTKRIIASPWVAAPVALLYFLLIFPQMGSLLGTLSNPSAAAISAVLGTASGATIGWAHFLAFDLFVGRWAYLDNQTTKLSPWLMAPILFFILMMGPIGFLLYLIARALKTKASPTTQ